MQRSVKCDLSRENQNRTWLRLFLLAPCLIYRQKHTEGGLLGGHPKHKVKAMPLSQFLLDVEGEIEPLEKKKKNSRHSRMEKDEGDPIKGS